MPTGTQYPFTTINRLRDICKEAGTSDEALAKAKSEFPAWLEMDWFLSHFRPFIDLRDRKR